MREIDTSDEFALVWEGEDLYLLMARVLGVGSMGWYGRF